MADKAVLIEANTRMATGKGAARKLRRSGKIPGVILDKGASQSIELDPKLLAKVYRPRTPFDLKLDGQTKKVVIKELQIEPVKRRALHVDLVYA